MNLEQKIESYLFYTGEPATIKKLAQVFSVSFDEIRISVAQLTESLSGRGIVLVVHGDEIVLATHPEMSEVITSIKKQELSDPLSKAALETLTLILYKGGAVKSEIDFIRGVNSGFMLRNLLVRGLIEKIPNPSDQRVSKYQATIDVLKYLGITNIHELPHFESFQAQITAREEQNHGASSNIFAE